MDAEFLDCPLRRRMEQKSTMMNRSSMALSGRLGVGPGITVVMVVGSDLTIEAGRFVCETLNQEISACLKTVCKKVS
jgi:hypothetical protein